MDSRKPRFNAPYYTPRPVGSATPREAAKLALDAWCYTAADRCIPRASAKLRRTAAMVLAACMSHWYRAEARQEMLRYAAELDDHRGSLRDTAARLDDCMVAEGPSGLTGTYAKRVGAGDRPWRVLFAFEGETRYEAEADAREACVLYEKIVADAVHGDELHRLRAKVAGQASGRCHYLSWRGHNSDVGPTERCTRCGGVK